MSCHDWCLLTLLTIDYEGSIDRLFKLTKPIKKENGKKDRYNQTKSVNSPFHISCKVSLNQLTDSM